MRLTQFTDYGLRVLMYLASREGEHVTTQEIAALFDVSWDHLLKVVRRLCELGYVEAKRGPTGGVRFLPATREVTVGEIVRRLEPELVLVECFDERTNTCPLTPVCGLSPVLRRASAAFLRELDQVTVRDLMAHTRGLDGALRTRARSSGARARDPRHRVRTRAAAVTRRRSSTS